MSLFKLRSSVANMLAMIFFISTALSVGGCAQDVGQALNQSSASQGQGTAGNGTEKANVWANVDLQGTASNAVLGTFQVFRIDTVNNLIILSIPLPVNPFGTGASASYPLPQIPGATVSVGDNGSGQQTLEVSVPLSYLVKGIDFDNPTTLPNGNPLPAIPGGELPRIGASFQNAKFQIYLYGSVKYFAVFVPIHGFNPYVNLTFPINNSAGTKILGYVATVTPQGSFDGGVYLTLVFPPELQAALDNLFS